MSSARIIQRNLVYVTGLSQEIATEKNQATTEFFGQYGNIKKIIVTKDKTYHTKFPHEPSFSAYITYCSDKEASLAILSVGEVLRGNNVIKASYGTTNYCYFFVNDQKCKKPDCPFLHSIASKADCYPKDKAKSHKQFFEILQKSAIENLRKYSAQIFELENKGQCHELPPLAEGQARLREHVDEFGGDGLFFNNESTCNHRLSGEADLMSENSNGANLTLKKNMSTPAPKIVSACGWGDVDDDQPPAKNSIWEPINYAETEAQDPLPCVEPNSKKGSLDEKSFNFEENPSSTKKDSTTKNSTSNNSSDCIPPSPQKYEISDSQKEKFSKLDLSIFEKLQNTLSTFESSKLSLFNRPPLRMLDLAKIPEETSKPKNDNEIVKEKKEITSFILKTFLDLSNEDGKIADKLQTLSDSNATADTEEKKANFEDSFDTAYNRKKSMSKSSKVNHEVKNNNFSVVTEPSTTTNSNESSNNGGSDINDSKREYRFFDKRYNSIQRCKVNSSLESKNKELMA